MRVRVRLRVRVGVKVSGSFFKLLFTFPKRLDENLAWKCVIT